VPNRKAISSFKATNPDEWVIKNDYQNRNIENVLQMWEMTNRHLSILIRPILLHLALHPFYSINDKPYLRGFFANLASTERAFIVKTT